MNAPTLTPIRPGFPSATEIARIRHRLACGDSIEKVAEIYGRRPSTISKFLQSPQHNIEPGRTYSITTKNGSVIKNLTLQDLARLAPSL
jgi:hypothetical protein